MSIPGSLTASGNHPYHHGVAPNEWCKIGLSCVDIKMPAFLICTTVSMHVSIFGTGCLPEADLLSYLMSSSFVGSCSLLLAATRFGTAPLQYQASTVPGTAHPVLDPIYLLTKKTRAAQESNESIQGKHLARKLTSIFHSTDE